MSTVFSKVLAFGVIVAACVGASALPASADPTYRWTGSGTLRAYEGVELGIGKVVEAARGRFEIREDTNHVPRSIYFETGYSNIFSGKAVFPIRHDGQSTSYWLQVGARTGKILAIDGSCEVFHGEPGTPDAHPTSSSPFECVTNRHGLDNDFAFIVGVANAPESLAEASGTITPTNVALKDGVFNTDTGYRTSGAASLAAGESTEFDTALRHGDTPFYENQARMEWAYQVVDNTTETGLWVAGLATNYRGTIAFSPDGRCAIYAGNPLAGGARLDDAQSINSPLYTCTASGEKLHGPGEDDNRHFHATFTVSKAPETTVSADIDLSRVTLANGKLLDSRGTVNDLTPTIDKTTRNALGVHGQSVAVNGAWAYRVSMNGEETPFWVKLRLTSYTSADEGCVVYHGDPSSWGRPDGQSPFSCTATTEWQGQHHKQYHYAITAVR